MKTRLLGAFAAVLLLLLPNVNYGQDAPDLGTTSTYALFSATGAFNNIGATTTVTGDVGTHVGAFNAFPPGILVGQRHVADPGSAQAAADVRVAYSYLDNVTCGKVIDITMGSGQILKPDVYCLGAASTLNGDLILDGEGDPSRIFIFKIDGALSTTTFSKVILKNSASICNVYWQINGQVQLGENSVFQGTIVANGAIILLDAASLFGRGLTQAGAISLQNNVVNLGVQTATPVITASGPTTLCPGGSVKLSGNKGGIWSTGATTPSITVTKAGDYFV
ncbi:MAG: ice-binding family protein, partial [Cyclobacteriaceae bacterium]